MARKDELTSLATDGGAVGGAAYLAPLTGIRGIAALAVLILHLNMAISGVNFGDYVPAILYGYLGVDLFFILSGFIISHVYADRFLRWSWRTYGAFMWHRFSRLYPVHVFVLLVLGVMVVAAQQSGTVLNQPDRWQFSDWPAHLLIVHAWGVLPTATWNAPAWSISAEWLAYIVFPIAVALTRPLRSAAVGLAATLALLLLLAAAFAGFGINLDMAWIGLPVFARVLLEFLMGCCLYRTFLALGRPSPVWDGLGVASLALFALSAAYFPNDFLMIGLIALFVMSASRSAGFMRRLLSSRAMIFLGEISYSIYMIHFAFILVLTRVIAAAGLDDGRLGTALGVMLASIALVVLLSTITYRLIERPGRTHLRALVDRPVAYAAAER